MAPTRATPRPLVESNTRERNNDACLESGPAPERRRPGAERALAAAAALDHGDRANYRLWYESAVAAPRRPQASETSPTTATEEGPPPRVTSGAPARDHGLLLWASSARYQKPSTGRRPTRRGSRNWTTSATT